METIIRWLLYFRNEEEHHKRAPPKKSKSSKSLDKIEEEGKEPKEAKETKETKDQRESTRLGRKRDSICVVKENLSDTDMGEFMTSLDFLVKRNQVLFFKALGQCCNIVKKIKVAADGSKKPSPDVIRLKDEVLKETHA